MFWESVFGGVDPPKTFNLKPGEFIFLKVDPLRLGFLKGSSNQVIEVARSNMAQYCPPMGLFTLLPFYPFTLLSNTLLPFYPFTLLPFYPSTLLPFYPFTLLPSFIPEVLLGCLIKVLVRILL